MLAVLCALLKEYWQNQFVCFELTADAEANASQPRCHDALADGRTYDAADVEARQRESVARHASFAVDLQLQGTFVGEDVPHYASWFGVQRRRQHDGLAEPLHCHGGAGGFAGDVEQRVGVGGKGDVSCRIEPRRGEAAAVGASAGHHYRYAAVGFHQPKLVFNFVPRHLHGVS